MLTKIVGDRVYDFSHVVGGRDQVMWPVALDATGDGEVFAITTKPDLGCNVARYSVGPNAGDEEVVANIGSRGEEPGKFVWPSGVALDSDKYVYVTDAWMDRVSVFTPDGDLLRTFGSSGDDRAQFRRPSGITVDANDDVLVVDTLNHRVQRLTREGEYISEWGGHGSDSGELYSPWGITSDADGCVYVADHKNHRIQKFDADGAFIFELGSHGSGDYGLDHPSDVAVDPEGDIYVCDWANSRVQAFDADGSYITTFIGDAQELSKWQWQYVSSNPDVYKARRRVYSLEPEWRFALPAGVAFDAASSRLMVADTQRWRIQIYNKVLDYSEPQFNI